MSEIVAIIPSRGRYNSFARLMMANELATDNEVELVLAYDDDDEYAPKYAKLRIDSYHGPRKSLSAWTNLVAKEILNRKYPPDFLVSLGDDHLPKTVGWHRHLSDKIKSMRNGTGFAYGDDLYHGSGLCTSWMVSSDIVRTLGWMMLPSCNHMYVDNAIMELGHKLECIAYVPEVIIEHIHPIAKKAEWDRNYLESHHEEKYRLDLKHFRQWRYGVQFESDIEKVSRLINGQVLEYD